MIDDRNIVLGQYIPGQSFLYSLDPRLKITTVVFWTLLLFFYSTGWELLAFSLVLLTILLLGRIHLFSILKSLKVVMVIVTVTFLLQALLTPGKVIFGWNFLTVTDTGLSSAILYSGRILILVVLLSVLTTTTPAVRLADGMELLLSPLRRLKVPVDRVATLVSIILMFLPNILENGRMLIKAQTAKGADFESKNLFRRLKNLVLVLIPLFIKVFRQADALATAMYARCYGMGTKRTRLNPLKIGIIETIITIAVVTVTVAIIFVIPG